MFINVICCIDMLYLGYFVFDLFYINDFSSILFCPIHPFALVQLLDNISPAMSRIKYIILSRTLPIFTKIKCLQGKCNCLFLKPSPKKQIQENLIDLQTLFMIYLFRNYLKQ